MGSDFNPKSYSAFGATSGESQWPGKLGGRGQPSGISRADGQVSLPKLPGQGSETQLLPERTLLCATGHIQRLLPERN